MVVTIGPPFSGGGTINDRGSHRIHGRQHWQRAFLWERGRLTPLPKLRADQTYSWALDINNAGRIVGTTVINSPRAP